MIRPLAAFVAALLLASCGVRGIDARPALWRISDGDTEIWLLGTIHALPPGAHWQTPPVARAIAAADTLVTEIPAGDAETLAAGFTHAAGATGGPPLIVRVAPEQRAAAAAYGARFDGLKSWAAAVAIGAAGMRAAGASSENGVEAVLARRFAGRRHLAFETQASQLALFDALPEGAQRVLLAQAVGDPGGYTRTLAAWSKGDTRAMAASFASGFDRAPVLRQTLLTRRNARWAGWIARRMTRPGRILVAVGAGHLVGNDSAIAMLSARGLEVQRLQ